MLLRCTVDGLMLEAHPHPRGNSLVVHDGDESFELERVEGIHYELVAAQAGHLVWLQQAGYRFLRLAGDFQLIPLQRRA
jgi:hypothetical protein